MKRLDPRATQPAPTIVVPAPIVPEKVPAAPALPVSSPAESPLHTQSDRLKDRSKKDGQSQLIGQTVRLS